MESWPGPRHNCVASLSDKKKRGKIYLSYIKVITVLDILLPSVPKSQLIVSGMVLSNAL